LPDESRTPQHMETTNKSAGDPNRCRP
jgi:hypothetical protein